MIMITGAELREHQLDAESMMTLTLIPHEPDGYTKDADDYRVPKFVDHGPTIGKVQGASSSTRDAATRYVRVGDVDRPVIEAGLHIPIGAPVPVAGDPGTGWEYEVAALGDGDDPALLGKRYLVVGVPAKSKATARRLDVVEV